MMEESNETARKDAIYQKAIAAMRGIRNAELQQRAIDLFKSIPNWRDADERIPVCEQRILAIREKEEADRAAAALAAKKRKRRTVLALSILAGLAVFTVLLFTVLLPAIRYGRAKLLMRGGQYEKAITAFAAMGGYGDSEALILDCRYGLAADLAEAGDYEAAITAFEALQGYRDSAEQIEACRAASLEQRYATAMERYRAEDYEAAYPAFAALDGYKDSAEKADEIEDAYQAARLRHAQAGDLVVFGTYEQDNDLSNGAEKIEWLVLTRDTDKALLISRYALDCQQYNSTADSVSWETCTLRTWLNKTFLDSAFSADEQTMLLHMDAEYGNDRVLLLNQPEAYRFFRSDEDRRCAPTDYAVAQGVRMSKNYQTTEGRGACWWWLRTPYTSDWHAACVNIDGSVYHMDIDLYLEYDAVRPVVWIQVNDD